MDDDSKYLKHLTFLPAQSEVLARSDKTLLEVAIDNKIDIDHSCGGGGTCGTCLVNIRDGKGLLERNEIEREMADERGFESFERLACQTLATESCTVEIPDHS